MTTEQKVPGFTGALAHSLRKRQQSIEEAMKVAVQLGALVDALPDEQRRDMAEVLSRMAEQATLKRVVTRKVSENEDAKPKDCPSDTPASDWHSPHHRGVF